MVFRSCCLAFTILVLPMTAGSGMAADSSNLPLPRFESLHSEAVNLRTGPGKRYPIDWVYNRRDLPVEVIAEFEDWRKIRDWQGTEGWVQKNMLSLQRMIVVTGRLRDLRAGPDDRAAVLARIQPNVVGRLLACPRNGQYCRIGVESMEGWLKREEFWGVYQTEFPE